MFDLRLLTEGYANSVERAAMTYVCMHHCLAISFLMLLPYKAAFVV